MIAAVGLTHFLLRCTTVFRVHRGLIVVDAGHETLLFLRDTMLGLGILRHLEDGIAFSLGDDRLVHGDVLVMQMVEHEGMSYCDGKAIVRMTHGTHSLLSIPVTLSGGIPPADMACKLTVSYMGRILPLSCLIPDLQWGFWHSVADARLQSFEGLGLYATP